MGSGGAFAGDKAVGREAKHPPLSSVKVEDEGSMPPIPQYAFWSHRKIL
jgi:hypothetical protein